MLPISRCPKVRWIALAPSQAIPEIDYPLLNMSLEHGKPENLIVDRILVPPIPIRPSVDAGAAGSNEDDEFNFIMTAVQNLLNSFKTE